MNQQPDENIPDLDPASDPSLVKGGPRSLRELIDLVTGRDQSPQPTEISGLAESLPFPFLALVGQSEMKLALLLSVINPAVGGVLLIGPRGTGKTTAVRSLLRLLPSVTRSACFYGCLPEDVDVGGMDAICPDCAKKYGQGESLTLTSPVSLVELPLNATLEEVIGRMEENGLVHIRQRLVRGILAQADQNLLFVDEVNLLPVEIIHAILDAAALGRYTVQRGPFAAAYRARFSLIGSMNPEEGKLGPQIMDRFGLRVVVRGLEEVEERQEAYQRSMEFRRNPTQFAGRYQSATEQAREEIEAARDLLPNVVVPPELSRAGINLIQHLQIDSIRAETTLFESARALAAMDGRVEVSLDDLRQMAPLALRMRHSDFIHHYFEDRTKEDQVILAAIDAAL